MKKIISVAFAILGLTFVLSGCVNNDVEGNIKNSKREVVIYTSVDQTIRTYIPTFEDELY